MLNSAQEAAARHGAGPALVLAGPGTGKTTTLVARYAYLVDQGVDPREVFVSTFTRKAARELKSRIRTSAGTASSRLPIGTFHAYCYRLTGATSVIEEPGRYAVIRECLPDWRGDLRSVLEAIDRFKDSLVSPAKALEQIRRTPKKDQAELRQVAEAYACYQSRLADEGLVDFGDLVWQSIELLQSGIPTAERFAHLLIDEYQDINPAQNALIDALLNGGGQLWVVGDDDQAIYGWRGSDVRFITSFARRYPGVSTYQLEKNYRSSKLIVDVSQALVSQNTRRLAKSFVSSADVESRPLCIVSCRNQHQEAEWVCGAVQKLIASGVSSTEIAILIRTNIQTLEFEATLSRAAVKFVIRGGGSFWELPVVKALMAAVWRADGPGGRPPWSGPRYLQPILHQIATESRPFPALMDKLTSAAISARPRSMPSEKRIQWDSGAMRLGEEGQRFSDAKTFLTHCREVTSHRPSAADEADAVVLSTIHQAKGLEWEAVFLVGCEEDLLPHSSAEDYEEERRLAYVAASRAKRYLTLTWAGHRGKSVRAQSPFISELCAGAPPSLLDLRNLAAIPRPQRKAPRKQAPRRKRRQIRVRHAKFGEGTVESVFPDRYVVRFDKVGKKKILSRFLELLSD